jgi:D-ribose pyranose/furanose isomerase RbsD
MSRVSRTQSPAKSTWLTELDKQLPLLGHRNWIVITDAAYPLQISPGIETIAVPERLVDVTTKVLKALNHTQHVRPLAYLDSELESVAEAHAPGVNALKTQLTKILAGIPQQSMPHEEIISRLDLAGSKFRVLLLKSTEIIPYSSVFLELNCGYWSDDAERARISAARRRR